MKKCNNIFDLFKNRYEPDFIEMDYPIYYTFKDFEGSYQTYLEKWQSIFIDGEEKEFLDEIYKIYSEQFETPYIEVGLMDEEYPYSKDIHLREFFNILNRRLDAYIQYNKVEIKNVSHCEGIILNELIGSIGVFGLYEEGNFLSYYSDNYNIDIFDYKKSCSFLEIRENNKGEYSLIFDEVKFKNFQFAKKRVFEFIDQRKLELEEDKREYNTIEGIKKSDVIASLHATGIIEHLKDKFPNSTQRGIARFFENITNGYLTERSNHSQFTTNKDNVKAPKELKPEIIGFLKDCFNTEENAFK